MKIEVPHKKHELTFKKHFIPLWHMYASLFWAPHCTTLQLLILCTMTCHAKDTFRNVLSSTYSTCILCVSIRKLVYCNSVTSFCLLPVTTYTYVFAVTIICTQFKLLSFAKYTIMCTYYYIFLI